MSKVAYLDRDHFRTFLNEQKITASARTWIEKDEHPEHYNAILEFIHTNLKFKENNLINLEKDILINGTLRFALPLVLKRSMTPEEEEFVNDMAYQYTFNEIVEGQKYNLFDWMVTLHEQYIKEVVTRNHDLDMEPETIPFIDILDTREELTVRISEYRFFTNLRKLVGTAPLYYHDVKDEDEEEPFDKEAPVENVETPIVAKRGENPTFIHYDEFAYFGKE